MLDSSFKEQLRSIFSELKNQYTLNIIAFDQHDSYRELVDLLDDVASCSDNISCQINKGEGLE